MRILKILLLSMLSIFFLSNFAYSYAAYTSNYIEPTNLIKYGSTGTGVKWVQDMLKQNGYTIEIDGAFGNITKNAVVHFQRYNNLDTDGIVGPATRAALKKAIGISTNSNSATSTNTSINAYRYTTANVHFRSGPGTTYLSNGIINKGTKIYVYQKRSNGWAYVKYNNKYGYVSANYLASTAPNTITSTSTLPTFNRNSSNLLTIIQNCKTYYANNNFYYSLANGVRSIPADQSKTYNSKRYVDCSSFVTWALYEYAKANGLSNMMNYFSYQRNSATFASIGASGGNNYLQTVSSLSNAKPGDILVSPGHVEFFSSYTKNSNGTYTIKVYNCGSDSCIKNPGITTSATKYESEITYILRVK
ncbi:MAG: peptidoglycan-binding protein [Clostridia bacterium]|nr:peptidoglycan-binding protein [Clostridia bacterium]